MEEDWDNLIILDACRYDLFKKYNDLPGNLGYILSRGSSTHTYVKENFNDKKYYDTVYITSNPVINALADDNFFKIISVWKDGWDSKFGTVTPETMVEYSIKAQNKYPNKRLIIHFVQPHYPFLGASRKKIQYHRMSDDRVEAFERFWEYVREQKVDTELVWTAYKENFIIVLKYVAILLKELRGKSVITADHGNLFGERVPPFYFREYGHPSEIRVEKLVKVPWHIIEDKKRKKIVIDQLSEKSMSEKERIKSITRNLKGL